MVLAVGTKFSSLILYLLLCISFRGLDLLTRFVANFSLPFVSKFQSVHILSSFHFIFSRYLTLS
jgi:hypothetical protein